jgi:hypothetical protein
MGRKTKGGRVMMSSPLMPPPAGRAPEACGVAEVGVGVSAGEGVTPGVGVGVARNVKVACGLGWTLAYSVWTFGLSPANGLTTFVKLPLSSVTTEAATWVGTSQ